MPNSRKASTAPITSFIPDLDRLTAEIMADWKVPGAALAVVQDRSVALTRAYGQRDVEANLPVTPSTQFAICSITKSFTATALALLHHEGRLDWSKPVRAIMPEFRLCDPVATDRVTVLDLPTAVRLAWFLSQCRMDCQIRTASCGPTLTPQMAARPARIVRRCGDSFSIRRVFAARY